jgi:prepilin-type N-terminal cleavage/methylation domain-containing protein
MSPVRGNSAFSLVEVMVAILILGIALAGLTQGLSTALGSSKDSEVQTAAALFAAGKIETLRAEGELLDGTEEGDCGEDLPLYQWRQTISSTTLEGLHEVEVIVENAKSQTAIYELRTLLFEIPASATETESNKSKDKSKARGKDRREA